MGPRTRNPNLDFTFSFSFLFMPLLLSIDCPNQVNSVTDIFKMTILEDKNGGSDNDLNRMVTIP